MKTVRGFTKRIALVAAGTILCAANALAAESDVASIWSSGSTNILQFAKQLSVNSVDWPIEDGDPPDGFRCELPYENKGVTAGVFKIRFNTFYWEAELRSLFEACEAVTPASARLTDPTCKTYHYLMDKLDLDEDNNEQMVRQDNLLQCPICEEVTAPSNVKPVAVINATGFLVVHNGRFATANQTVLVQVGFGSLSARLDEATSFVRQTDNAAVFVVVPPGERAEYTGKDVLDASSAANHEQDVTMAMAADICDDDRAPQPCLFFRDLEDWKFPDGQTNENSDWYDVWRLNNPLEETTEADADELPYAGPLEFQDSTYHDLLDTDPYPQDSWFYRATFTMMRAITLLENLPDFPGVQCGLNQPYFDPGVDAGKIAIGGVSRGGMVAYMVNALDDRVDAAIVGGAAGHLRAGYDETTREVTDIQSAPFTNAGDLATCEYGAVPQNQSEWDAYVNPFTPSVQGITIFEPNEVRDDWWSDVSPTLDCSIDPFKTSGTMPSECAEAKRFDPTYNDDSLIKEAILAGLYCDADFDAALSVSPPEQTIGYMLRDTSFGAGQAGTGATGVNYALTDRRDCEIPADGGTTTKQEREVTAFLKHFDPRWYLNGTTIKQQSPVLLIVGAQDQVFPINTVKLTMEDVRAAQPLSILQIVPNWDHPFYYGSPAETETATTALGMEPGAGFDFLAMTTGSTTRTVELLPGLGGSFHPFADFFNLAAGEGIIRASDDAVLLRPRLSSPKRKSSQLDPVTAFRFYDMHVDEGGTSMTSFFLPTVDPSDFSVTQDGLLSVTAAFDAKNFTPGTGNFIPPNVTNLTHNYRLAVSWDRNWTYGAGTKFANPLTNTFIDACSQTAPNPTDNNYGATCEEVLAEPLCRREGCEPGTCENEHTAACLAEYTLCREPFPMTDLVSYDSGTQTGEIRTNISLASDKRVEVPSPFHESEVIYFIEVYGTYDLNSKTYHFYYTSLPMTPPESERQLDASLAYGTDTDEVWFRPRLRAHGGVGPASGDTCCSYPGEVVLVDSESISSDDRDQCPNYPGVSGQSFVIELAVATGDGIGDPCDNFGGLGSSTPYSLQDVARLRGSAWAGRGDVAGDPQTTVAFFFRRGAQLADNDRDGIGNYCESGWNYDGTNPVVFNDGLDDTDQPDPGGHGVPGGLLPAIPPAWFANCFTSGCEIAPDVPSGRPRMTWVAALWGIALSTGLAAYRRARRNARAP